MENCIFASIIRNMNMKFTKILVVIATLFICTFSAEAQKFGVRVGLNYNTIMGPTIANQTHGYSNGFHFGINYSYLFTDRFSLRAEIGYVQNGYKEKYNGDGFYIIRTSDKTVFEKGKLDVNLRNSNGYISIPIVANIKVSNKFEVNAGVYSNILISPIGQGILRFESHDRPEKIVFRQSLSYNYLSDKIGYQKGGVPGEGIAIFSDDDEIVRLPQTAGAYYQYAEDLGSYMNRFDFGITGGVEYFVTRGFFVGINANYGFLDITNDAVDYRRSSLDENNEFIFDKEYDHNFGVQASIGFRF